MRRTVARMARELVEHNEGPHDLALMGIHRRGVQIAQMIQSEIERAESIVVPLGTLDITLYRDDLMAIGPRPVIGESTLPGGGGGRQSHGDRRRRPLYGAHRPRRAQ